MLAKFFITDQNPSLIVSGVYDPHLVTLSIATAIFAAYFSLYIIDLANKTEFDLVPKVRQCNGRISNVWWDMEYAFHRYAGFSLCTTVNYDPTLTFYPFLPAFLACYICFSIFRRQSYQIPTTIKLASLGSVLLGAGIGTMHYTGMAAMELSPLLRYDPLWFAASIVMAVLLSFIGLYSRFHLSDHFKKLINVPKSPYLRHYIWLCSMQECITWVWLQLGLSPHRPCYLKMSKHRSWFLLQLAFHLPPYYSPLWSELLTVWYVFACYWLKNQQKNLA